LHTLNSALRNGLHANRKGREFAGYHLSIAQPALKSHKPASGTTALSL
jgi:hypothetical protein